MRKQIFFALALLSFGFACTFFSVPSVQEFVIEQAASVIGIDIDTVYAYQKDRGLTEYVSYGDSGKEVSLVQRALHVLVDDFPEENVTGYFGDKTREGLMLYQQKEGLSLSGTVDEETQENLNKMYFRELCPEGTGGSFKNEILVDVDRDTALPKKYIPDNLVDISEKVKTVGIICVKKDIVSSLEKMMNAAKLDNVILAVASGFRRPEIQSVLINIWWKIQGATAFDGIAEPYHSEHQLGTAIDFSGASNSFESADVDFASTPESEWLKKNAHKYGFIMSYPEDKTDITGYMYEPWHYRFVGVEVAKKIFEENTTVTEYMESLKKKKEK